MLSDKPSDSIVSAVKTTGKRLERTQLHTTGIEATGTRKPSANNPELLGRTKPIALLLIHASLSLSLRNTRGAEDPTGAPTLRCPISFTCKVQSHVGRGEGRFYVRGRGCGERVWGLGDKRKGMFTYMYHPTCTYVSSVYLSFISLAVSLSMSSCSGASSLRSMRLNSCTKKMKCLKEVFKCASSLSCTTSLKCW